MEIKTSEEIENLLIETQENNPELLESISNEKWIRVEDIILMLDKEYNELTGNENSLTIIRILKKRIEKGELTK